MRTTPRIKVCDIHSGMVVGRSHAQFELDIKFHTSPVIAFEIGDEGPTGANTAYQDRVCWEHKVEVDQKMRSIPLQHSKELAKRLCH